MNPGEMDRWKCAVLDEVFVALAAAPALERCLVFKGARVLQVYLGAGRQSLDIDSNLLAEFTREQPDRELQRGYLEVEIGRAVRRHFEAQEPVRYELTQIKATRHPPRVPHPLGWDAFVVRLNVNDRTKSVRGLPALEIDVAAPEELTDSSVERIRVGGHPVYAYTLQRIAGEKLRAFLSSLPTYRAKVRKPGETVRAKDLYDVARIHRHRRLADEAFWLATGQEFRIACRSRYIDCTGLETFQEEWAVTQKAYEEPTIPRDVPFAEAASTLEAVIRFLAGQGLLPFSFPLPGSGR